ncbi:TPA: hypothetical protein DDZ75_00055 [Patescibacteria group bacterium]|nr:hypothetical protein [Patescibacteria group bacterium]
MVVMVPVFAQEGAKNKAGNVGVEVTQVRAEENNRVQVGGEGATQFRAEEQNKVNAQVNATDTGNKPDTAGIAGRGEERRSEVANAVKELLAVADRDGGIGEKVREIARNHNDDSNKIEDTLKDIKNRGQFRKFLFGPDYKKIYDAEEVLIRHDERMAELKALLPIVKTVGDKTLVEQKIAQMEEIKVELQKEVSDSEKVGFSLFGWLNKMLNKK